ncbi:MAG: YcxB family protein [Clostridiales bacterium]|jgi:hypothetical protein|nr:YcxB family protein [Clostridiales bacterium]
MYAFDFTLYEEEYIDFSLFYLFKSPENKQLRYMFKYGLPVASLCFTIVYALSHGTQDLYLPIILVVFSVFWLLFSKKLMQTNFYKRMKRVKASGKFGNVGDQHIEFNDEHIFMINQTAESKINYEVIEKVVQNENAIYIVLGVADAIIIPLRIFENQESQSEFLKFLENKSGCSLTMVDK